MLLVLIGAKTVAMLTFQQTKSYPLLHLHGKAIKALEVAMSSLSSESYFHQNHGRIYKTLPKPSRVFFFFFNGS